MTKPFRLRGKANRTSSSQQRKGGAGIWF